MNATLRKLADFGARHPVAVNRIFVASLAFAGATFLLAAGKPHLDAYLEARVRAALGGELRMSLEGTALTLEALAKLLDAADPASASPAEALVALLDANGGAA